ncbi:TetR/AcrR family transcriptional regulator [Streptomyces sp. NPDC001743]|uniref:TetR/AcrR family transcriptional regulator n=1 Tax=Streptomyces sp. NPDC001743 TaxID=3154397 RepID=UPI00331DC54D
MTVRRKAVQVAGENGSGSPGGTGLPASIEAAWGLRPRPVKGPRPGLSPERIVGAAVAVAAAEGLSAVSMGRVAKDLGVATMSLYRYVAAKDELFVLMQEAALGSPPPLPAPEERGGWREALSRWARSQSRVFRANPWMLRIPLAGPPASPHSVAWWEQGLQALAGTGLEADEKVSVLLLISGFVRNDALLAADLDAAAASRGVPVAEVVEGRARTLDRLVDPARQPALARLKETTAVWTTGDPGHAFAFGLERVLDGVGVLVAARAREHGTEDSGTGPGGI